ncbi:hypothetical protein HK104_000318 [Borealophlyctis nickersoniae]|nr:hypothetical protein HK104_000318 [Borealophlyctis nickersoniae]
MDPNWKYVGQANWADTLEDGPLGNINFVPFKSGLKRTYYLWKGDYCWNATFAEGSFRDPWAAQEFYDAAYQDTKEIGFTKWAETTEALHGFVHNSQGGSQAQMTTAESPLDDRYSTLRPTLHRTVFWLHHSNVDLLWHDVQTRWNTDNKNQTFQIGGSCPDGKDCLTVDTILPYYGIRLGDVQFIAQQCVKYAPMVKGAPTTLNPSQYCPYIKPVEEKVDCGFPGITAQQCQAKGCCWVPDKAGSKTPWCFVNPASGVLNMKPKLTSLNPNAAPGCRAKQPVLLPPLPEKWFTMNWGERGSEVKRTLRNGWEVLTEGSSRVRRSRRFRGPGGVKSFGAGFARFYDG